MKILLPALSLLFPLASLHAQEAAYKTGDRLFVTERVSVMSDSGVTSLIPGAKVKVLSQSATAIKVSTADGTAVDLKPGQLTRDANLAASLAQQNAQAQAALLAKAQSDANQAAIAQARSMESLVETHAKAAPVNTAPPPSSPLGGSSLDAPATKVSYKVNRPNKKQDPNSQGDDKNDRHTRHRDNNN